MGESIAEMRENTLKITDEIVGEGVIHFAPEFYSVTFGPKIGSAELGHGLVAKAVYTINKQTTNSLFSALTTTLVSSDIRTSGGFFNIAEKLSQNFFADFTLTLIPSETNALRSLHISLTCSDETTELPKCDEEGNIDKQIT